MTYQEFITRLKTETGVNKKVLRDILRAIPGVLWELAEEEKVRTPLGVFEKLRREGRANILPNGQPAPARAKTLVRLREGVALIEKDDPASEG